MKMAADLTNAAEHSKDVDQQEDAIDRLDNPAVGLKRSNWAKRSREEKAERWRFPRVPSGTALDTTEPDTTTTDTTTEPDTTTTDTPDSEAGLAAQNETDTEDADTLGDIEHCEHRSVKCKFFLSLSMNLDSLDEVDGPCEEEDTECLKAVNFLQSVPDETRQMVVRYLSIGNPEHLTITKDNLHHVFHLSKMLNLLQLYNECMKFCINENNDDVVALFDSNCECREAIAQESKTGYKRFISIVASNDDDTAVEFYVLVSTTDSGSKPKNIVKVIDMKRKEEIFQKNVHKLIQLGSGSDCCCVYKKESPYIFACGGEGKLAQSCYKYDVLLGKWSKCPKLPNARLNHKVVSADNTAIYVIGGRDTACIDQYTISANKWSTPASLIFQVQSPVCSVYKDRIYIFGGKTVAGPVASVQCYDTFTNRVTVLPDLPCEVPDGKAITFEDNIYIATEQGHMICFVPETGESYLHAQQPVQRKHFGMFLKNERLYLVGGVARSEGEGDRSTPMYRFNPKKDTWTAETDLCESFPVYSSCVVRYPKYCPIVPFDDNS